MTDEEMRALLNLPSRVAEEMAGLITVSQDARRELTAAASRWLAEQSVSRSALAHFVAALDCQVETLTALRRAAALSIGTDPHG